MTLRIAPLVLAGLAGLTGLNGWLLTVVFEDRAPAAEVQAAAAAPARAPSPPASDVKPPAPKSLAAYPQTLARPAFFKTRAPYVPPPPAPPPPPKPAAAPPAAPVDPGLVLGGVVIIDNVRQAYIFNKADARGAWLSEGETIQGWTVESIDAMTASLRQAGRSIELQLYPTR